MPTPSSSGATGAGSSLPPKENALFKRILVSSIADTNECMTT